MHWIWRTCPTECHILLPVYRCGRHGSLPLQAPDGHFLPDALAGPGVALHHHRRQNALVSPDVRLQAAHLFQGPVRPQLSGLQQSAGTMPHPAGPVRIFGPARSHPAGPVSAAGLLPAERRDEDQVRPEETMQRLFHRATQGRLVCVLQDPPQTQAEAGLRH